MNLRIRHTEASDSPALQDMHAQLESLMGTLQLPYPTQQWKRLLHHFYEPFPTVEHYAPVMSTQEAPTP